jgi:DNA-binding NarL/FixJ family response regulator
MSTHDDATAPGKIRILIVDDHEAIRSAVVALLSEETDLAVVATVESEAEALDIIRYHPVDLAIIDVSLGRTNGLDLTRQIRVCYPSVRVLILSMHDPALYSLRAAQAGASAYVAKQDAPEILVSAIHRVFQGQTYFPPDPGALP